MKRLSAVLLWCTIGCGGVDPNPGRPGGDPDLGQPAAEGCTQACVSGVELRSSSLQLTLADLQGSSIQVCRNQECYQTSLALEQDPPDGVGVGTPLVDPVQRDMLHAPLIEAIFWKETDGYQLEVDYAPWISNDAHDGDVYDITLTASDGRRLLEAHHTVTYNILVNCGGSCLGYTGSL